MSANLGEKLSDNEITEMIREADKDGKSSHAYSGCLRTFTDATCSGDGMVSLSCPPVFFTSLAMIIVLMHVQIDYNGQSRISTIPQLAQLTFPA